MKILLIEDNRQNSAMFVKALKIHGYTDVQPAYNAADGLAALKAEPFDVAFIDFDLPDLHGLDVALAIRSFRNKGVIKSDVVMVGLTAQSDTETRTEALECGFMAFIGKPCTDEDLVEVLETIVASGR